MGDKKNYFIIDNGTQLINAIEFIEYKNLPLENNILIIISDIDVILSDLKKVISQSSYFTEIRYLFKLPIGRYNNTRIGQVVTAFSAKKNLKKIITTELDTLVIGNYQNVFCKLFVKYYSCKSIVVIDDGPSTLEFFNKPTKKLSKVNSIVEKILNVKNYHINANYVFTRFYKQINKDALKNKTEIIENKFTFLKSNISEKKRKEEKLFIGYPIVEENVMCIERYVKLLLKIKDKTGAFIYIPHRREMDDNLKQISKHIIVNKLGMPFEIYLYNEREYPSEIIGFFSTVFFNVNEMFGEKIKLKYVKIKNLKIVHIHDINKLYKEISKIAKLVLAFDL